MKCTDNSESHFYLINFNLCSLLKKSKVDQIEDNILSPQLPSPTLPGAQLVEWKIIIRRRRQTKWPRRFTVQRAIYPHPHLTVQRLQVGVTYLILMRINMKIISGLDMFPNCKYPRFCQVWEA